MAGFIKNIFGVNKSAINDPNNTEDLQSILIQKWNNSQKSLNNLDLLFNIQDENFIIKELINIKALFKINEETEYWKLIGLINLKENKFKNTKIIEIINNIKEFDKFKYKLDNKQLEINKIVPGANNTSDPKLNKKDKNLKSNPEEKQANYDLEFSKFFFIDDNFQNLVYSDKKQKTIFYSAYLEYLINNVLIEYNISENSKDFYKHEANQSIKMNEFIQEISLFVYTTIFEILISKENYFEIIYNLFSDIENCQGNNLNSGTIKNSIMCLLPNKFNYRKYFENNFFRKEFHLNFLFTNKQMNSLIKDKDFFLDTDLVNIFLNFLIDFEFFIDQKNKKTINTLLINNQTIKPNFFKVYDYILEIIFDNHNLKNIRTNIFELETDNNFKQMILLDYLMTLYKTTKNFNRNFNSKELIDIENDLENSENEDKEKIDKNPPATDRRESFNYLNNYNLEKFLTFDIDNCINDKVLAKEILTSNPEEIRKDTNILNNFIEDIFTIVFLKTQTKEKFASIKKNEKEILEAINNNFIFNEKIKKLPEILFLKIIRINSPINIIENFFKKYVDLDIDKGNKNEFLKFLCFTTLKNSFEILTENADNYPHLIERLELINNFYETTKLISNIKIKIAFLDVFNKKNNSISKKIVNENNTLNLKNLIFEEEKFKSYIKINLINNNSTCLVIINNVVFGSLNSLKQFKNFAKIYEFLLINTNKFKTSKGLKLFKFFEKELVLINNYLDLNKETVFPNETSDNKYLTIVEFILFFIKNEKLEILSLEFLKENVIFPLLKLN